MKKKKEKKFNNWRNKNLKIQIKAILSPNQINQLKAIL